jgi:signal peptidase I
MPMDADPYDRTQRGLEGYDRYLPAGPAPAGGQGPPGMDDQPSRQPPTRRKRKTMPLWQELPLLLIVAFCLAVLIRTFLLQAFYIPSGSMENTLLVGDRVLVNKVVYDVRDPERGEIVVFRGTDTWAPETHVDTNTGFFSKVGHTIGDLVGISQPGEKDFIKRVIGLPGDTVSCCDVNGNVFVNGYALDERSYIPEQMDSPRDRPPNAKECGSRRFDPVTVSPGQIFVMGDHRLVSQDSRCQGQVPIDNVIGRAFVIVWPSGRWNGLPVPATFAKVPKPNATGLPETRSPAARVGIAAGSRVAGSGAPAAGGLLAVSFVAPLVVPARSRRSRLRRQRRLR